MFWNSQIFHVMIVIWIDVADDSDRWFWELGNIIEVSHVTFLYLCLVVVIIVHYRLVDRHKSVATFDPVWSGWGRTWSLASLFQHTTSHTGKTICVLWGNGSTKAHWYYGSSWRCDGPKEIFSVHMKCNDVLGNALWDIINPSCLINIGSKFRKA